MAAVNKTSLPKVLVYRSIPEVFIERIRQRCEVFVFDEENWTVPREKVLRALQGMDGLVISPMLVINRDTLDAAGPQLRVISNISIGVDHVDLDLCKERDIKVGHAPCTEVAISVAEFAIALALAAARRIGEASQLVRQGVWGTRWENTMWLVGKQLAGSVVGVVGLGRIGLAVVQRLQAFGVNRILYSGRNRRPESELKTGVEFSSFENLLEQSDFVIATCSVDTSNTKMFNSAAFSMMKQGSVFVNVTRGALVDQQALLDALTSGHLGAAALDVTTPEPLPPSHPLVSLPNVIITPHIASAAHEPRYAAFDLTVRNLLAGLFNEPMPAPVNLA